MTTEQQLVYIGTYTHQNEDRPNPAESIYVYEFDPQHGTLKLKNIIPDVIDPSFLALASDGRYLVAVSETDDFAGTTGGGISAFALTPEAAQGVFINAQPTQGAHPCYLTLDATGRWVVVANYSGGSITMFPVAEDGQIGKATAFIQHHGRSVHPTRQDAPHAHCAIFDPAEQHVLVTDLGLDQILVFRFDATTGLLAPHDSPFMAVEPGAGPRHLAFHPNGRYLYVTNELNSTVGVYDYDHGALQHRQTLSTLPADFEGENYPADVHVAISGQFLYTSNRGHDSIAVFAIDAEGQLSLVETVSSGGQKPRNFAFDVTENFLLVANQGDDKLVVLQVDQSSGRLTRTSTTVSIPSPVCVKVVKAP